MKWRSLWAVVAGVLFIVVVTTVVDLILHAMGFFPAVNMPISDMLAAVATAYRIVISIAGGWLTARLAPNQPMQHALILGLVGTLLGVIGAAATWNLGLGPHWYPVALAVLALPQCWIGGKIYVARHPA
jgi:hypothetical protein